MSFTFEIGEGRLLAFGTPILRRAWQQSDELDGSLAMLILERERKDPGATLSNVGAWHSTDNLLDRPEPALITVRERIGELAREMTRLTGGMVPRASLRFGVTAWATVARRGAYHKPHNHPNAVWSGVYYVRAGDGGDAGGVIELLDPRIGADARQPPGHPFGGTIQIRPVAGTMLMFPGWLVHFVSPYSGEDPRISIAFNVLDVEVEPRVTNASAR